MYADVLHLLTAESGTNHPDQGGSALESEAAENKLARSLVVDELPYSGTPRWSQFDLQRS